MALVALATNPQPRKLRVGLFADCGRQPRWLIDAFAALAASEFAEVVLIAVGEGAERRAPWLVRLYERVDRWAFGAAAVEEGELASVPHRTLARLRSAKDFLRFDLDVAFALGTIDDAALEGIARYGVWRFDVDGFREVAEGEPLTGSALKVRAAPGAAARLAYQSWSRTYPFSVARNREQLLRKCSQFAYRALTELHRSGQGWLEQRPLARQEQAASRLTNAKLISSLHTIGSHIARRALEKALYVEQWFLAYRLREAGAADAREIPGDLSGYVRLVPPKDRYWADPFAIERGGRYFLFFEELLFSSGKAHIAMVELDAEGRAGAPVRVLERDYHLSYPFLIEEGGELYMIPETAQNGTVELYRCIDFPLRWRLEGMLLEGVSCVDATFHKSGDRWWMFANAGPRDAHVFDDELHLFYADELRGPWRAHRRNPIKSDARCARPAGALYWRSGALYRPAQICVPLYGAGLSINRVLRLTPHDYAERQVERVLPGRSNGIFGLHTINRTGRLTVIDAFTRRRRI